MAGLGMTRLLLCHDCRSIDELPDYVGPPEYDVLLDDAVSKHRFPDGNEHMGKLCLVNTEDWENNTKQAAILEEIKAAVSKSTGLPSEWYETKNQYQADALKCYTAHRRPTVEVGCNDYRTDNKRLGNPSKVGWQVGPRVYLCQFCPYQSTVTTAKRHQRGDYK